MILSTIEIAQWRCFLEARRLGPFSEELNVIYAPNGSGKSTLFEALCRALLDGHRVGGKDIEAIRPWGRELTPRVTVEFQHNGHKYRITKQFVSSQSALLEREEQGRMTPLAEGAAADEQTRTMLTKNQPGRGLARPEHWGIAQVLWAPQGALAFSSLSGDLLADIRGMLGAQVAGGTATGPMENRINERYYSIFTPGGKLRSGRDAPAIERLRKDLAQAEATWHSAMDDYLAFEEAARRVEECQSRRTQSRHLLEEIDRRRAKAHSEADHYRQLHAERDRHEDAAATAEARHAELDSRVKRIRETATEMYALRSTLASREKETPLRDQDVKERKQELARCKAALEDARKNRKKVEAAKTLADEARHFTECSSALIAFDGHLEKLKAAAHTLTERKTGRHALVAPDAKTLRAAHKSARQLHEAQLCIDASLITLEIVPRHKASAEVVAGEQPGTIALTPDSPVQVQGSPELVVDIPGVARLRAWGPVGAIETHRENRDQAAQQLRSLFETYAVPELHALDALADKAKLLDAQVAEAETVLQTLCSGKSIEACDQERSAVAARRRHFLDDHPEWDVTPPEVQALQHEAAEVERAFIAAVENAEDAWEKAQSAHAAAAEKHNTHLQEIDAMRRQERRLAETHAELTDDGKTPEEREKTLRHIAMTWEAARERLNGITAQCARYDDDPRERADALDTQYEAAQAEAGQAREQELREETRLEQLSAQGAYTALALAEEQKERLRIETAREELRIDAVRLLHDTVADCRNEALASVSGGVEATASRTFQRIAGRRLGRIQVDEHFAPSAVVPEIVDDAVALANLSGGEQEQLYLATRLALADALSKEQRQLVVLDDVLTATDAGRLARITTILEEAAQRLQLLILTCHPERYRGLKQCAFFDLEQINNKGN